MNKIDLDVAEIVANNLNLLMKKYNLTIAGLEAGAGLEAHTINRILSKTTNISSRSAKKLAEFFGMTVDIIFSNKPIKFQKLENIPALLSFYKGNHLNNKYFLSRAKENVIAHFLRTVLVHDSFLNDGKRTSEISEYIKTTYKKNFNPKTIAKELFRLSEAGLLKRDDRTGKGSVYYYSLIKPILEVQKS